MQEMSPTNNLLTSATPGTFEVSDSCGFTSLHFAAYHGNSKAIMLLVEYGANITATNK